MKIMLAIPEEMYRELEKLRAELKYANVQQVIRHILAEYLRGRR